MDRLLRADEGRWGAAKVGEGPERAPSHWRAATRHHSLTLAPTRNQGLVRAATKGYSRTLAATTEHSATREHPFSRVAARGLAGVPPLVALAGVHPVDGDGEEDDATHDHLLPEKGDIEEEQALVQRRGCNLVNDARNDAIVDAGGVISLPGVPPHVPHPRVFRLALPGLRAACTRDQSRVTL